ncbi:hypothetical protein BFW01_g9785 [Lasiodiplodia theobromae]|nr:hypothetical protein BFW01_g9785 [Lasiodiplodia theobromae]
MPPNFSKEFLRQRASWIRDDLDPRISRDGPDCMQPDDVLTLHELFLGLQDADLSISVLRYSRIHVAVLEVAGKATRWPKRLAEECDKIIDVWTKKYGKLSDIRPRLFKPDGRLYGVCTGSELTRDALVKLWSQQDPSYMSPDRGMQHGSLGFRPGDWWINGTFAFHAGIIDLNCTGGGICADKRGAYAVVMEGNDEVYTETPDKFKYRCKPNDPGRFRMTAADFKSRYPIRVLRSHTLNSLWAPRSGMRYEGLHKTTGWTIKPISPAENDGFNLIWEIELERDRGLEDEYSQMSALKHPTAEETDDYMEYKRVRREMLHKVREGILTGIPAKIPETPPAVPVLSEKPGDYCLMRDPVLPGSPESPPLSRTSFFQPAQSPRAKTGPAVKQEREKQPQARSLTVPQNLRKSRSNVSTDSRAKKSQGEATSKKASQHPPDNGVKTSVKDFARPQFGGRDAKGSIAKSFTRIFSDGAQDSDIPESPFGSVLADYDNGEPSSFPFDKQPVVSSPPPITPLPPSSTAQSSYMPPAPPEKSSGSSSNPILRQVHWGTPAGDPYSAKDDLRQLSTGRLKREKSRHHQRRDRAVYEAFDRQAESADPRLLLAALNEVWDDCAEPEYPDMVLEEPMAYESSSGYQGGYGGEGAAVAAGRGGGGSQSQSGGGGGSGSGSGSSSSGGARAQRSRSDDYMLRIPPGGIDVARFIAQQAAGEESDDGGSSSSVRPGGTGARKSWPLGDDAAGTSSPSSVHEIRSVLREMSESSATSTEDVARRESQRLSSSSASTSSSSGGSSISGPSRRRRSSSLGAFDSRMPTWTPDEGGGSAVSRRARRPTIVRFSGMFKRQSLEETVDEVVDEGAAGEEEEEEGGKGGGVLKEDREEVKAMEEIGGGFGDEPL